MLPGKDLHREWWKVLQNLEQAKGVPPEKRHAAFDSGCDGGQGLGRRKGHAPHLDCAAMLGPASTACPVPDTPVKCNSLRHPKIQFSQCDAPPRFQHAAFEGSNAI